MTIDVAPPRPAKWWERWLIYFCLALALLCFGVA